MPIQRVYKANKVRACSTSPTGRLTQTVPEVQEFPKSFEPWPKPTQRTNSLQDIRLDLGASDYSDLERRLLCMP